MAPWLCLPGSSRAKAASTRIRLCLASRREGRRRRNCYTEAQITSARRRRCVRAQVRKKNKPGEGQRQAKGQRGGEGKGEGGNDKNRRPTTRNRRTATRNRQPRTKYRQTTTGNR